MNYQKIYDDICHRGQIRILPKEIYTETHHIIPKCMGGSNDKNNLTILTAREHFIVHYILTRIYPNNSKIWNACFKMCIFSKNQQRFIPDSKLYAYIKSKRNELNRGMNHHSFGKKFSDDHKKKIGAAHRGKVISVESINKRKATITNKPKIPYTDERLKNLKEFFTKNNPNSRKCSINDVIFLSVSEASRKLNLSTKIITKRLKSQNIEWINWIYLEDSKCSPKTRAKIKDVKTGKRHTSETKKLLSELFTGDKNNFYGKHHTDETKQKISQKKTGVKLTDEHKCKLSECKSKEKNHWYGITGELHPLFGYKHSEKFCKDIQNRQLGDKNSFYGKHHSDVSKLKIQNKCKQSKKCLIDGIMFKSIKSASRHLNIPVSTIRTRLKSNNLKYENYKFI